MTKAKQFTSINTYFNLADDLADDLIEEGKDDLKGGIEGNPNDLQDLDDGENGKGAGGEGDDGNDGGDDSNNLEEVSSQLRENISLFNSENPSEDVLSLKSDLLKEFKGEDFDKDGNIVDKDGKIITSFEDVVKELAKQEEDLYDEEGNLVDKDGKVLVSKKELDLEKSQINTFAKKYGIKDEKGEIKVYEDSDKGFEELVNDISINQTNTQISNFLNSNPVLREVAKHLELGKDISEFQAPIDYKGINTKELSIENKKRYIKQSYIAEGVSEGRADNIVKGLDEKGIETALSEALDVLQDKEDSKVAERAKNLELQQQQEVENTNKYWEGIKEVVSKGNLDGFEVPSEDRVNFFNYMAIPVENGLSQDQLDRQASSIETQLKEAYYRFKGYKLDNIVRDNVNKRNTNNLRNRLKRTSELSGKKSNNKKDSKEVDVSIDSII